MTPTGVGIFQSARRPQTTLAAARTDASAVAARWVPIHHKPPHRAAHDIHQQPAPKGLKKLAGGRAKRTPPVTRPQPTAAPREGCVNASLARSTRVGFGGRDAPDRRAVREPGGDHRMGPQTAWEDGGSAVLQVVCDVNGRDKSRVWFPNREFTHPFRVPADDGGQAPGVSLRSTPG